MHYWCAYVGRETGWRRATRVLSSPINGGSFASTVQYAVSEVRPLGSSSSVRRRLPSLLSTGQHNPVSGSQPVVAERCSFVSFSELLIAPLMKSSPVSSPSTRCHPLPAQQQDRGATDGGKETCVRRAAVVDHHEQQHTVGNAPSKAEKLVCYGWSAISRLCHLKTCVPRRECSFPSVVTAFKMFKDERICMLWNRLGDQEQIERFRVRRIQKEKSLQQVRRLLALRYPAETSKLPHITARAQFLFSLDITELRIKVQERDVTNIEQA